MIYYPIDVKRPVNTSKMIEVQYGLTSNFPEIVFELHDGKKYFDLGDNCIVSAVVQNTDLETYIFTGTLEVMNPHRGQILCRPNSKDFTMTGINTVTFRVYVDSIRFSFQVTIFVEASFIKNVTTGSAPEYDYTSFIVSISEKDLEDKQFRISNANITKDSEVHISVPDDISIEEYDAIALANVAVEQQMNGYIDLKLLGDVPSIPLRFKVTVRNEI